MKHGLTHAVLAVLLAMAALGAEIVNRGVVALPRSSGDVYVGWRYLLSDKSTTGFNVYRSTSATGTYSKLTGTPVTNSTNYVDGSASAGTKYYYKVAAVNGGTEGTKSAAASVTAASSASYVKSFSTAASGGIQRICTGDVNGDGYLDVAVLWPNENKDPYYGGIWNASTNPCDDTYKISMYLHDGTFLWTYDLGWGIELGVHYSPFMLWDIDDDGKAEVILKTLKSTNALDYSKEYLTVLDGMTKAVKKEVRWVGPPSGSSTSLTSYNNNSRNHLAIAYLDGSTPSIIVGRGTYQDTKVAAFSPSLSKQWEKDFSPSAHGRSSHGTEVADVDGDGKDEIIWGDICIESNGSVKWLAPKYTGHPDLVFVGDILPSRAGLEVFYGREGWSQVSSSIGNLVMDANSGAVVWKDMYHVHVHTGMMGDFSTKSDGMEMYTGEEKNADDPLGPFTYKSTGEIINNKLINGFPVQWDASGVKRLYETGTGNLVTYDTGAKTYIGKGAQVGRGPIIADLWGDFREEILCPASASSNKIVIYTNNAAATKRKVSLLLDKKYREGMARTGQQYLRQCFEGGYYFDGSVVDPPVDTDPPVPTGMTASSATSIAITFNEPVTGATGGDKANYAVSGGVTVTAASLSSNGYTATLTTSQLTSGTAYGVTVSGVADEAGNVMPAAVTVSGTYTAGLVEEFACAGSGTYRWSVLADGEAMYTDRDYEYGAVPYHLAGKKVLQTAMDDKSAAATDDDFIGFLVTADVTVYVLYTDVNATLADKWLTDGNGWTLEAYTVPTSIPGTGEADRLVRKKAFTAGTTVTLGGHGGTDPATSMYTVVVEQGATVLPDLINGFITTGSSGYAWFELGTGDSMYCDRGYAYSSVPSGFLGALALRTAMDDKAEDASDSTFISFTVSEQATVYVLYTDINAELADVWLNGAGGWTVESYTVSTTIPGTGEADRKVAYKTFGAGGTVNLGGHGATDPATSMYTVVVVPGSVASGISMPAGGSAAGSVAPEYLFDQRGRRVAASAAAPGVYFKYVDASPVKVLVTGR